MNAGKDIFASCRVERANLNEQIIDQLQNLIADRRLPPGTRLPSERELARIFGVNRTTVGEAIHLLEHRGLVKRQVGRGTFVSPIDSAAVADSLQRFFFLGSCSFEELLMVRELWEPPLAAVAAQRATAEDLETMKSLATRIEEIYDCPGDEPLLLDMQFHGALAAATQNKLVAAISASLHQVMRACLQAQARTPRREEARLLHRRIVEAIATRDPRRAEQAMREHLQNARASLAHSAGAPEQGGSPLKNNREKGKIKTRMAKKSSMNLKADKAN